MSRPLPGRRDRNLETLGGSTRLELGLGGAGRVLRRRGLLLVADLRRRVRADLRGDEPAAQAVLVDVVGEDHRPGTEPLRQAGQLGRPHQGAACGRPHAAVARVCSSTCESSSARSTPTSARSRPPASSPRRCSRSWPRRRRSRSLQKAADSAATYAVDHSAGGSVRDQLAKQAAALQAQATGTDGAGGLAKEVTDLQARSTVCPRPARTSRRSPPSGTRSRTSCS